MAEEAGATAGTDTDREAERVGDIRKNLLKTRIAPDLLQLVEDLAAGQAGDSPEVRDGKIRVLIEVNSAFPGGTAAARELLIGILARANLVASEPRLSGGRLLALGARLDAQLDLWPPLASSDGDQIDLWKSLHTESYIFGTLHPTTIEALAVLQAKPPTRSHPVYKIWRDIPVSAFVFASARTIKCDAARIAFSASGEDIVWAVADTGIDENHPHFQRHGNLVDLPEGLLHRDFTTAHPTDQAASAAALIDSAGHGTHVAGIIAGETVRASGGPPSPSFTVPVIEITRSVRTGVGAGVSVMDEVDRSRDCLSGMAPRCKLLSLKVLANEREGGVSDLIAAIGYVRQLNGPSGPLKVHGVNLSLGYAFDPKWFAAGQSPLCNEVDRLVRSGVVVVVAAGNAGYGRVTTQRGTSEAAALVCTIADPGNAELAITVGSSHRDMPHVYGVSYFSSKGPTADGRLKPDIVAPGERIISCAANARGPNAAFKEDSGTSMAAPHVSGAIAAFLSVRREFIERPEDVKTIFVGAATDLRRRPEFQGGGLLDLMRALQSV